MFFDRNHLSLLPEESSTEQAKIFVLREGEAPAEPHMVGYWIGPFPARQETRPP
ncbi:MAG: hypothetical protein BECKG1743D_GA0114223_112501, partial [Candidatus Kentron sp. G]